MPLEELLGLSRNLGKPVPVAMGYSGRRYRAADHTCRRTRTYLVEAPGGYKSILRVHRENYHSHRAIECELDWLEALDAAGIVTTPGYLLGQKRRSHSRGARRGSERSRAIWFCFNFVEGEAPDESGEMSDRLRGIGGYCRALP